MKLSHHMNKNSLLVLVASSVLVITTLVACGGGGGGASGVANGGPSGGPSGGLAIDNSSPAYDLNGFKQCGTEFGKDITLTVDTHVAYGLAEGYRLVYLFNQKKGTVIKPVTETFGGDPLPSVGKLVYCKPVTNDNNDAAVFKASIAAVKSTLDTTSVLSSEQLQLHINRLKQTMYAIAESEASLLQAFDVITAYEKMRGGAFFSNEKTKNGFPNENYGDTGRDIDRAVLTVQQGIHDIVFSPDNVTKYKNILIGKKFNSHEWFPGKVRIPADPSKVNSVRINATMVKDVDNRSAFSGAGSVARRPTGFYLAAGDVAKVTVPSSMVGKGFVIQVGANPHDKTMKSKIVRPFRVTNRFPIAANVTEIANPNGGGIYIDVPYLADAGSDVTITIQNAVAAPLFSKTALNATTLQQWKETQRMNPAPWADFVSDKFMMTLPTKWIEKYEDPITLMKDWDDRMDIVSDYVGRSRVRNNQILYLTVDTDLLGNAFGIGYPTGNNTYNPGAATDGNNKNWYLRPDKDFSEVEFHELGHAQLFSDFPGEGEASINILSVAVSNKLYGVDFDRALSKSMNNTSQLIGRDQAAVGWMVRQNFRDGKAMGITSAMQEKMYVQRGYAKYVEIAALFGWDKLEKFYLEENRVFRKEAVAAGAGLADVDSRILRMSIAAGVDLTPLIHFWGVQPVKADALSAAIAAAGLKPSVLIYDRLARYEGMIPMTNAAFQVHAAEVLNKSASTLKLNPDNNNSYGEGWYKVWIDSYGPAEGQAAKTAFATMLKRYFPNGRPN
jgi:Peptidase M60, enhancin and enhancin-like/N-terminal domain of M60-like peptidases